MAQLSVPSIVTVCAMFAGSFATDAEIGDGSVVGPFCHLPPGSSLAPGTVTGPFYTSG